MDPFLLIYYVVQCPALVAHSICIRITRPRAFLSREIKSLCLLNMFHNFIIVFIIGKSLLRTCPCKLAEDNITVSFVENNNYYYYLIEKCYG